jgi:hypothetical protein
MLTLGGRQVRRLWDEVAPFEARKLLEDSDAAGSSAARSSAVDLSVPRPYCGLPRSRPCTQSRVPIRRARRLDQPATRRERDTEGNLESVFLALTGQTPSSKGQPLEVGDATWSQHRNRTPRLANSPQRPIPVIVPALLLGETPAPHALLPSWARFCLLPRRPTGR